MRNYFHVHSEAFTKPMLRGFNDRIESRMPDLRRSPQYSCTSHRETCRCRRSKREKKRFMFVFCDICMRFRTMHRLSPRGSRRRTTVRRYFFSFSLEPSPEEENGHCVIEPIILSFGLRSFVRSICSSFPLLRFSVLLPSRIAALTVNPSRASDRSRS